MEKCEFHQLFCAATGYEPYPWQDHLVINEQIPLVIDVPTGLGKTPAAILAWLWRRRFAPEYIRNKTPRRLVYCLPTRSLVTQTEEAAREYLKKLGMLASISIHNNAVEGWAKEHSDTGLNISVYVLMGGSVDNDFDGYPEIDAIIIGTQDQLLSRALNRGYSMSRYRHPIHFSLLNNDSFWVFDEVQLMGAGLSTSRQLQAFRDRYGAYGPTRSMWMSATLQVDWLKTVDNPLKIPDDLVLRLSAKDKVNPRIRKLLSADKALFKAKTRLSKDTAKTYAKLLASEVKEQHIPGTVTLIVINSVTRAQDVFKFLKKEYGKGPAPQLVLLHGQLRTGEQEIAEQNLKSEVCREGKIICATQVVEAGLNITSKTLFTELAPWASLVQRFGRNNRFGDMVGQVFWIDVDSDHQITLPYLPDSMDIARDYLGKLQNVCIENLPMVTEKQPITYTLRDKDLKGLFDNTPDLSGANIDVSLFIRDSEDLHVQVFWRNVVEGNPNSDVVLMGEEPWLSAKREELCMTTLSQVRKYMKKKMKIERKFWVWDGLRDKWKKLYEKEIRPGLLIMLDAGLGGYDAEMGFVPNEIRPVTVVTLTDSVKTPKPKHEGNFVTIKQHSQDVLNVAREFCESNSFPWQWPRDELLEAARLHDIGKSHPVNQETMLRQIRQKDEHDRKLDELWAKTPYNNRHLRRHFRHELASALAYLEYGKSDLVAYLIICHHGKVRMSLQALPDETRPSNTDRRYARGIWDGETLPDVELYGGIVTGVAIDLSYMEMGDGPNGPSWVARTVKLLEDFGPFRLAWLETLLRVSDWRGSEKGGMND